MCCSCCSVSSPVCCWSVSLLYFISVNCLILVCVSVCLVVGSSQQVLVGRSAPVPAGHARRHADRPGAALLLGAHGSDRGGPERPISGADRVSDPGDLRVPDGGDAAPRVCDGGARRPEQQSDGLLPPARLTVRRDAVAEEATRYDRCRIISTHPQHVHCHRLITHCSHFLLNFQLPTGFVLVG